MIYFELNNLLFLVWHNIIFSPKHHNDVQAQIDFQLIDGIFMISHEHKCIFVEVPKTGSSSIRAILGKPPKPHLDIWQIKSNMENHWTHYGGRKNFFKGVAYSLLPEKTRIKKGESQFDSYFKFGFVRNPWDRVVSLYHRNEGQQMEDTMSFDDFVYWIKYSSSTCIHPSPHVNQLDWLVDPSGKIIVDFIGKFENLKSDWEVISKKINLQVLLPHANRNKVPKKHYSVYYSKKTRNIIEKKFITDIEYFEYEFN
jgi:hypothetical protein